MIDVKECREWLQDYEQDMFNIACQRCRAPFKDHRYAVAAPPEWFGVIDWLRAACDEIEELRSVLEATSRAGDRGL